MRPAHVISDHRSCLPWICVAAAALSASAGCHEGEAAATSPPVEQPAAAVVEVVEAARVPFARSIEISANVLPLRTVGIVGQVPGTIEAMLVDVGARVVKGQPLVRLDRSDYNLAVQQAQAQLAAAKANTDLAAIGVQAAGTHKQRMQTLHDSQVIAESELEKVDDGYRVGLAKQSAADAQLQLARVGLSAARSKLADTVIRAPFDGIVLERSLDEGSFYHPSSPRPLLLLAEDRQMRIEGSVGERDLRHVTEGMAAQVFVDAIAEEPVAGTVEVVSPMVDPRTRTASVRVTIDNADGRLGTGMSARVELDLGSQEVVAVPDDALERRGSGDRAVVYVVDRDERARRREVVVGGRDGALVEVVDGLEAGQLVVRGGQGTVEDGEEVVVARGGAEAAE